MTMIPTEDKWLQRNIFLRLHLQEVQDVVSGLETLIMELEDSLDDQDDKIAKEVGQTLLQIFEQLQNQGVYAQQDDKLAQS